MAATGITLRINYIPRVGNWPNGPSQYICGAIPSDDAQCFKQSSINIEEGAIPWTFAKCCNGPIVNVTQPITDPQDPSYGAQCLAYCPVDYSRTFDSPGHFFSDYWDCISLSNLTRAERKRLPEVLGRITCGWVSKPREEQCLTSVEIEKSIYSASTAMMETMSSNMTRMATATPSESTSTKTKSWPVCTRASKTTGASGGLLGGSPTSTSRSNRGTPGTQRVRLFDLLLAGVLACGVAFGV